MSETTMNESNNNVVVAEFATAKPYTFRKFTSTDVFPMFKILGNKINEVQGTTCGLGTPHALKFRSRGRSLHSLTSSGPISHHPPSCIFPLGDWLLLETEYLKQMASLGSLHWPFHLPGRPCLQLLTSLP